MITGRLAFVCLCSVALHAPAFAQRTIKVVLGKDMSTASAVGNLKHGYFSSVFGSTNWFKGDSVKKPLTFDLRVRKGDIVVVTNKAGNLAKRNESTIKKQWAPKPADFTLLSEVKVRLLRSGAAPFATVTITGAWGKMSSTHGGGSVLLQGEAHHTAGVPYGGSFTFYGVPPGPLEVTVKYEDPRKPIASAKASGKLLLDTKRGRTIDVKLPPGPPEIEEHFPHPTQ